MNEPRKCQSCRGRGWLWADYHHGEKIECNICDGQGVETLQSHHRNERSVVRRYREETK